MSITKRTVEISNKEKEDWEMNSLYMRTTEWLKQVEWLDWLNVDWLNFDWLYENFSWVMLIIILWIIPSIMAIKESVRCENKMNVMLSLLPILNIIIYMRECENRNGVGYKNYLNSGEIYPSIVKNPMNSSMNKPMNISTNSSMYKQWNKSMNNPWNKQMNSSMNKQMNSSMNKPMNNQMNKSMNKPKNVWNKY